MAAPGWGNRLSPSSCPAQLDGWIHEKMLMARDGTREDGHKLHKRWLRHQAFMAELAQNKEWLEKIERVRTQKAPLPTRGAGGLRRTHVPPHTPSTASLLFPHLRMVQIFPTPAPSFVALNNSRNLFELRSAHL